jgi:hypothetical protein
MANSTGAFSRSVARMIAKCATVVASEKITDDFVVLTLEAPNFRGVVWTPGTKIQVANGLCIRHPNLHSDGVGCRPGADPDTGLHARFWAGKRMAARRETWRQL